MTEQEMNVAIAEACGWVAMTEVEYPHRPIWVKDCDYEGYATSSDLPNYCRDLNAMHEAWCSKVKCSDDLEDSFTSWLGVVCCKEPYTDRPNLSDANIAIISNATARQRAEAFLRTIGKWKE